MPLNDSLLDDVDSLLLPSTPAPTFDDGDVLRDVDALLAPTPSVSMLPPMRPVPSHAIAEPVQPPLGKPGELERQLAWSVSPKRDAAAARMHQPPANVQPMPRLNMKTGQLMPELPAQIPILDSPAIGLKQIWEGIKSFPLFANLRKSSQELATARPTGMTPETKNAMSDIVEGGLKASEPLMLGAGLAAPIPTLIAVGGGMAAQRGAEKLTELAGADPSTQRLAGNVAAVTVGGPIAHETLIRGKRVVGKLAADARAVREMAGPPEPPRSTEPIPVGRGSTITPDVVQPIPPERSLVPVDPIVAEADRVLGGAVPESTGLTGEPESVRAQIVQTLHDSGLVTPVEPSEAVKVAPEGKESPVAPIAAPGVTLEASDGQARPVTSGAAPQIEASDPATRDGIAPTGETVVGSSGRSPQDARLSKKRARELDLLTQVVDDAVGRGFTGDREQLRSALIERAEAMREIKGEVEAAGGSGNALVRELVKAGGLAIKAETGQQGELRWLKESGLGKRWGLFTSKRRGMTLDGAVEFLKQDPRFSHIEDIRDLVDELTDVAQGEMGLGELTPRQLGAVGDNWWHHVLGTEPPAGAVDVLDTGEAQPRLPGAGAVRDVEVKTPEFEAPFSLTGEAHDAGSVQENLLHGASGDTLLDDVDRLLGDDNKFDSVFSDVDPDSTEFEPGTLGMAGKRRPAAGPRVSPLPGAKSGKQLRPSEIAKMLSTHLEGLPVRVGKFRQHALGIYKIKEQVVRLKVANDLDTLAHEIGHHIDESIIGIRSPQVNFELEQLGAATSRPSYSKKLIRKEGAAEFLRHYFTDPAALKVRAPNYYAAFEKALEGEPELKKLIATAQRQYQGHLALDPKDRLLSHIDFKGTDEPGKGDADLMTRLETAWVDDLAPMRVVDRHLFEGQPHNVLEDGYKLARLARGAAGKAEGFLRFGPRGLDGKKIGPSLEKTLAPVKDRIKDFVAYLVASHVPEREGKGKATGIDLNDARAVRQKLDSPEFRAARDGVRAYENALLEYLHQGGLHSDAQIAAIKKAYEHHIPLHRVQEALEGHLSGAGIASRVANRRSPVKRAHGSGADIINPLESLVRLTHAMVDTVEKNRAIGALIRKSESTIGGGRFFEKIPTPQELQKVNLASLQKDIGKALKDAGLNVGTVMGPNGPTLEVEGAPIDLDEIVKVFTPVNYVRGEKGVITFMKKGEPTFYQVNNLALYDAITAIGGKRSDLLVNLFMRPARALRAGATMTLGFLARNPIRDTFTATVNTRYGFRPGYDTLRGLFEYLKKGEDYQQFLNSGGANSAMVAMDRNKIREALARMNLADKRRFADSLVLNPMNLLRALSEVGENATRIGEFKRGVEKEGRTPEGFARAGLAARDVTVDFGRGGALSKEINRYTAFFNVGIQGPARIAEVFHKDPIGATFRAVTAIMLPTLALWYLNKDNEEYRELPAWEKLTYWHIPKPGGKGFIRVPTPFELFTVFGAMPHAALDHLYKKDHTIAKQMFPDEHSAWDVILSVMPTAILPAVEVVTNYDTFRKRNIVSPWDLGLDTELQYNRWTSELAKKVGPKIGLAPAKLDHLIYGYFAGLGRTAVSGVDLALRTGPAKPATGASGIPVLGEAVSSFNRPLAGSDAQSIQELYEARDILGGAKESVDRLQAKGESAKAAARIDALRKQYAEPGEALQRVNGAAKQLSELRKALELVWAHETLTPEEKRELQDRMFEQMVNAARAGLRKPALPSRFEKPIAPALLEKFNAPKATPMPARRAQ